MYLLRCEYDKLSCKFCYVFTVKVFIRLINIFGHEEQLIIFCLCIVCSIDTENSDYNMI